MQKRLMRSRRDRMVAGVCGGVGEYLQTDPSVVRLGWVLFALLGGAGFLLYVLAWIIIPERSSQQSPPAGSEDEIQSAETGGRSIRDEGEGVKLLGLIMVIVGGVLLIDRLVIVSLRRWWPLFLVIFGIFLLFRDDKNGGTLSERENVEPRDGHDQQNKDE